MPRTGKFSKLRKGVGIVSCTIAMATPAFAGMNQDLADCTASDRKTSVDACTRVMNSGRLPKEQFYIGHYNRGWSHFNAGQSEKALADFDKSISYNSGYADTYYSRAVVQHDLGHRAESLAELDTYLTKKGDVAEAYLNRARLFRARNEYNQAFSELQRAATLDPGDHKVEAMRALVLSDLGEQAPARAAADKAIAAKADDAGALYARALIAFREKDYDAAARDVDESLAAKEGNVAAHELKGRIAEQRGDADAAVKSYRRAVEIVPKSLDGRAAQREARARLDAIPGASQISGKVAEAPSSETAPSKSKEKAATGGCRRFIPSAKTTVAVECPQ